MSFFFNCSSVRKLVIVLSNKVSNTIRSDGPSGLYGASTTTLGSSSSTVQNADNVRRGKKKQEIYS